MTLQLPDRNVEPGPGELGSLDALARVWRGVQQNFVKLADLFPLTVDQLADGAAAARKTKLDVVNSGLVTGSGGGLSASWSNLIQLNYTTPSTTMQGILLWQIRFDTSIVAWDLTQTRVQSTPAPTLQLKSSGAPSTMAFVNSAGPFATHHTGFDYVQLAAGTFYPFIVQARAGTTNPFWPSWAENAVMGVFWKL